MTDSQKLLAEYIRNESESAFQELVSRYISLVYSTAVRRVGGDTHLAEDVAQCVFADFARLARTLQQDAMLGGWLHRHTCFVAAKMMRRERRRQARERQAVEINMQQDHSEGKLAQVAPILDETINQLGAADRTAILLRYFEQRDFRSVGDALGTHEDAARMRVARALEKLQFLLKRRGVVFPAAALGAALSTQAVTAVPVGLAASISTAALATAATQPASILTILKIMTATKLKFAVVSAVLIAGATTPFVIQHHAQVKLREENATLRQQVDRLAPLVAENDRLSNLLAKASQLQPRSADPSEELLKLRAEVARLRSDSQELARLKEAKNETTEAAAKSWLARLDQLKQRLEAFPGAKIPEFQFLTEEDWLKAAKAELNTDDDYRRAFSALRAAAEGKFAPMMKKAVDEFMKNNNKELPTDLAQLQQYFESPVDPAILQRWEIAPASTVKALGLGGDIIITQKDAVDDVYDTRYGIGPHGLGSTDFLSSKTRDTMAPVFSAFQNANNGEFPEDLSQLQPYIKTPEQQTALQKMILRKASHKQAW